MTEVGGSPIVQTNTNEAIKFKVKVQLKKPPLSIKPGLSAQADIFTGSRSQVLVGADPGPGGEGPQAGAGPDLRARRAPGAGGGLRHGSGQGAVPAAAHRAHGRPHVEVLSGLQGGESIITGPFKALRELKELDPVRLDTHKKAD